MQPCAQENIHEKPNVLQQSYIAGVLQSLFCSLGKPLRALVYSQLADFQETDYVSKDA